MNGTQPCRCYACHIQYEAETKRGKRRQVKRHAVILWEKERFGRARLKGVGKLQSSCFPVLDSEPAYSPKQKTKTSKLLKLGNLRFISVIVDANP